VFLSALLVLPLGCDAGPDSVDPEPQAPDWHAVELPGPRGLPGQLAVRDAVRCGGAWTAVGGVQLADPLETRDTRPAAWRSQDGVTWTALDVTATTYWSRRAVPSTVACADGRVVAVGARFGGAHGNPRITTFFEKNGGLDDQRAAFNLTGNRISGPAVWHSTDGRDFTIEEDVPGLADEEGFSSLAQAGCGTARAGWWSAGGMRGRR
jgi:hypothetical protein